MIENTILGPVLEDVKEFSERQDQIISFSEKTGANCLAYSDQETEVMKLYGRKMASYGARIFETQSGDITCLIEGTEPNLQAFFSGSHFDAVLKGGRYDGSAGVKASGSVAGLLHSQTIKLPHDYAVHIFRAEESPRFGKGLIGSCLTTGRGCSEDFARASLLEGESVTLGEAMQAQGFDVQSLNEKVARGEPLLPLRHIGGFMEMHIEQSVALKEAGVDLGVVTGIRGNVRVDLRYLGKAGHSGSMPMELREDAKKGMVYLQHAFYEELDCLRGQGHDGVDTVTLEKIKNSSATKVPDDVYARLEVRSTNLYVLEYMQEFLIDRSEHFAERFNLQIAQEDTRFPISPPVPELSPDMITHMKESAEKVGCSCMLMPSGAGHDAMNMFLADVPTSMYFIPHGGDSHVPHENMVLNEGDDPYALNSPFANAVRAMQVATIDFPEKPKPDDIRGQTTAEALIQSGAVEITHDLEV